MQLPQRFAHLRASIQTHKCIESTLKRHGYYCRSLQNKTKQYRPRSCLACAKSKARCDNKSPSCTRCVTKEIVCRPQINSSGAQLPSEKGDVQPRMRRPVREEPLELVQSGTIHALTDQYPPPLRTEYTTTDLTLSLFEEEEFDWEIPEIDVSGIHDLEDQPNRTNLLEPIPPPCSEQSQSLTNFGCQVNSKLHAKSLFIPRMPAYSIRSFSQNPSIKGGTQAATAMLMHRLLTSYPMMMRNPDSLPPFVHPSFLSPVANPEKNSFESLNTCMSLMQMVGTHAPGSKKLLWKNVRLECERMQEEVRISAPSIFKQRR